MSVVRLLPNMAENLTIQIHSGGPGREVSRVPTQPTAATDLFLSRLLCVSEAAFKGSSLPRNRDTHQRARVLAGQSPRSLVSTKFPLPLEEFNCVNSNG